MENVLGGFSALLDEISGRSIDAEKIDIDKDVDDSKSSDDRFKLDKLPDDDDDNDIDTDVDNGADEDSNGDVNDNDTDEVSDENEDSEPISLLFDAISESMEWEDIDEDKKPKTPEELVSYLKDVVEKSSVPQYASDEMKELDEFVRNGGNLYDYISMTSEIDYDSLDMSNEDVQKNVIKEFLTKKGFSEYAITRKIEKYEDAEILEDEATDAVEFLKEIAEEEKKALLENQKNFAEEQKREQQKFYTSVVQEIETLKDIRGIKIPQEDKKALADYLFTIEKDGKTKYQKDYAKSPKNIIESAYFTMKGDALINFAKKSGETSATDKFKAAIKSNKIGGSKQSITTGPARPLWETVSKQLISK